MSTTQNRGVKRKAKEEVSITVTSVTTTIKKVKTQEEENVLIHTLTYSKNGSAVETSGKRKTVDKAKTYGTQVGDFDVILRRADNGKFELLTTKQTKPRENDVVVKYA